MEKENALMEAFEEPPFDRIDTDDYKAAVIKALDEAGTRVRQIATADEEPTFENTVAALEEADRRLSRVTAMMFNLYECHTNKVLTNICMALQPLLTRFATAVSTNRQLFGRVEAVWEAVERGERSLNEEEQTLLRNTYRSFVRHGVALEGEEAVRYKSNEVELSSLQLRFGKNVLKDQNEYRLHLVRKEDLEGLPESLVETAAAEAARRGEEGWTFTLAQPMYVPFMTYSRRRDLREQMYRAYASCGNRGGENDNDDTVRRIVQLRAEQARLLGYDTYADYVLEDRMAGSLPTLRAFMERMTEAVLPAAKRDLEALREEWASAEQGGGEMKPWDVSFCAERIKQRLYTIDDELLRPYFPLEAVREGIFGLYGRLYGLSFEEDTEVPVYHEEVRAYRVYREAPTEEGKGTGERRYMGLLYLDMHPRPSKRSGAWMTDFRGQYGEVRPQIQVVCNFSSAAGGRPSLLRFSEVETFMHEMGHAMHGMLSEVRYESLSGTNVKRDFVEMPSQLMENWCYEPSFLSTFAAHYETGEPLPTEYIDRIRAAQNHLAGWYFLRQINLGLTDLAFHTFTPESLAAKLDEVGSTRFAERVEAEAMLNLMEREEGCCTATNFNHIFGGGYASGYYSYKWAEVLDADIFSRFKERGIFDRPTAECFRREILSRGGTADPALLFRRFMGRDPDQKALMRRIGIG